MALDHSAALELGLLDWGLAITLQVVEQTYDEATQTVSETTTESAVTAIVGPEVAELSSDTGGQHRTTRRTFLMAATDWPDLSSDSLLRVELAGARYDVIDITRAEATGLLWIAARQQN